MRILLNSFVVEFFVVVEFLLEEKNIAVRKNFGLSPYQENIFLSSEIISVRVTFVGLG